MPSKFGSGPVARMYEWTTPPTSAVPLRNKRILTERALRVGTCMVPASVSRSESTLNDAVNLFVQVDSEPDDESMCLGYL